MIKKTVGAIGAVLLILVVIVAGVCLVIDYNTRVGAAAGLLFGALSGPWRIAGVDFRQWFRDPGAPSEISDDSWIGLFRGAFHAIWPAALLAFFAFAYFLQHQPSNGCIAIGAGSFLTRLPTWLSAFFAACSGHWAFIKIVIGGVVGLAAMQSLVEITWRVGLRWGSRVRAPNPGFLVAGEPPRIPRKEKHDGIRRLIVCCDGTWNWPESKRETNVVRLVRAIAPDHNGIAQIVHYHQGVGTGNFVDRIAGGGAGVGLSASVKACYGFLVDNYKEHDEIFLFGFSRGAYVARALAGLIGAVGIMRKHEMDRFADVWSWYWQDKAKRVSKVLDSLAPDRFRNVEIECIGVWDTVGALGIPGSRFCASAFAFHNTELGLHVRNAFQALAIDERRGNFQAAVWVPAKAAALQPDGVPQVLRQVWFPGVHSNVGGGYPEHGLSDTTFLWMLSQVENLLGLTERCIIRSLDDQASEAYPGGKLEDSRTLFWRLVWAPIPRPVCMISETEQIHQSAWGRSNASIVPDSDLYKTEWRKKWFGGVTALGANYGGFEHRLASTVRPPPVIVPGLQKKLDWCSRLMQIVGVRG